MAPRTRKGSSRSRSALPGYPTPLAEWILAHPGTPHDLSLSGMIGALESTREILAEPPREGDPERLRALLAAQLGVDPSRLFLTHGAHEGNALVMLHLRRRAGARRAAASPTVWLPRAEYDQLRLGAAWTGFSEKGRSGAYDLRACSNPSNPLGVALPRKELEGSGGPRTTLLVDETFREFSDRPSLARGCRPRLWVTGTFTKAYGADGIRVGWVVTPPEEAAAFAAAHGLLLDRPAGASVGWAISLLEQRERVLSEARGIFRSNEKVLREGFPDLPELSAPVAFDRFPRSVDTRRLAEKAVLQGVLVCPGAYFGDASGIRLCLTRRSFPEDLRAYLEVRQRLAPAPGRSRDSPSTDRKMS